VIAVAKVANGNLRTWRAATKKRAREGLMASCKADGLTCKVVAMFDGTPEYF
jgi:hypothetical protein